MTQSYPPSPLPEYPQERTSTPEVLAPDEPPPAGDAGFTATPPRRATGYEVPQLPARTATPDGDKSKTDLATEQAASVGRSAADAGQQVAAVSKDQAQKVAAEAGTQAKNLLDQTRSELTTQAAAQQQRLASAVRALGDELHSMSLHAMQGGVATDLVRQASRRSHDVAAWLEDREPGELVRDVEDFARRRPGTFLLIAIGAGVLAGRLGRGLKDAAGVSGVSGSGEFR